MRTSIAARITIAIAFCIVSGVAVSPASTTGRIAGVVKDAQSGAPIADATVTVSSPSQTASTRTTSAGDYTFLSLIPDTYTVTVSKDGYDTASISGISVFADAAQNVPLTLAPSSKVLGKVTVSAHSSLNPVRPGTTTDVYSANTALTKGASTLGGGGGLYNAYSAIAAMPGAFVPPNQMGVNQTVYIRGGNFDQIGYEYDGVPVNRTFDNYPSYNLSTLGQQELQVYAGGGTTDSNATGLAGFVNQVVRSGTYPGFADFTASIGSPALLNNFSFEAGGATDTHRFSYYAGLSSYTQDFRYLTNDNGASLADEFPSSYPSNVTTNLHFWPAVYPTCNNNGPTLYTNSLPADIWEDPGCFSYLGPQIDYVSNIRGTAALANFHIGIPHHNDAGMDDIQLLYSNSGQYQSWYSSPLDAQPLLTTLISPANGSLASIPQWPDFYTYPGGTSFGQLANAPVIGYAFPGSPSNRCLNQTGVYDPTNPATFLPIPGSCDFSTASIVPYGTGLAELPADYNDARWDLSSIEKVQYQHNIGSTAYLRFFGYLFYSNSNRSGAVEEGVTGQYGSVNLGATNYDYEVGAHTGGGQLQYASQISSKNQIIATLNYLQSNTLRYHNNNYFNTATQQVSSLTNGSQCFAAYDGYLESDVNDVNPITAGQRAPCNDIITQGTFSMPTSSDNGDIPIAWGGTGTPQNLTCAGGSGAAIPSPACAAGAAWRLTFTGNQADINQIRPKLGNVSVSDEWKPNDRLDVSLALREDRDEYDITQVADAGKNFWYSAAQQEFCYNPVTLQPLIVPEPPQYLRLISPYVSFTCPIDPADGVQTVHPNGLDGNILLTDQVPSSYTLYYFLPRVGATYQINAQNVLRFSAGRYAQEPQNYEVEYNTLEPNLAAQLIGFLPFGYNTPFHPVQAQFSNNYDLSWEHQFNGTDLAMKLTPFYRWATNQLYETVNIPTLSLTPAFTSGTQRTDGVEFLLTKGDFNKNGLSGIFSYTYTNSTEMYNNYPGSTINPVDPYNEDIQNFNRLTKAGGGSPCYQPYPDGSATPCVAGGGMIYNPYYNMSPQPLLDKFGWYAPGLDYPYISPNVFALVASYRWDRLAVTPAFTLNEGATYGTPADFHGLDPRQCEANQVSDGIPDSPTPWTADYTSCRQAQVGSSGSTPGYLWVPNPYTNTFDTFGQFHQPWQLNLGLQLSYNLSHFATANVSVVNLLNSCFGGSSEPWTQVYGPNSHVCGYSYNKFFISNFYNGSSPNDVAANGVPLNPYFSVPFAPAYGDTNSFNLPNPTQFLFTLSFKM